MLEDYESFMSHIPFLIFSTLKKIFNRAGIISNELEEIYANFNPNIAYRIAIIFATNDDSKSTHAALELLNSIMMSKGNSNSSISEDYLSISLFLKQDRSINQFMPPIKLTQTAHLSSFIVDSIHRVISSKPVNFFFDQEEEDDDAVVEYDSIKMIKENSQSPIGLNHDKSSISSSNETYLNSSHHKLTLFTNRPVPVRVNQVLLLPSGERSPVTEQVTI